MSSRAIPRFLTFVLFSAFLIGTGPLTAKTHERWQCDLNLHQGDTGTLEFDRIGDSIEGKTIVRDGSSQHPIDGTWSGESLQFTRRLSATSMQPFKGVAVAAEGGEVKMGGRFAFRYAGVWSADCELVETKTLEAGPAAVDGRRLGVVDRRKIAETEVPRRVVTDDAKPAEEKPQAGTCSISGRATGPRADAADVFFVNLYGPDDDRQFRETARFDAAGRYRFSALPAGRYRLVVDTRADIGVGPQPSQRTVVCRDRGPDGVDFEFR